MTTLLEPPTRKWACPSCSTVDLTKTLETRYHNCPGLEGLTAPLVQVTDFDVNVKAEARHVLTNREDGPGIASCRTDHRSGANDMTVYAPTAVMDLVLHRAAVNRAMKDISVNPDAAMAGGRARHQFFDTKLARMARVARRLEAQMAWTTSNGNAYYLWAMGQATSRPNPTADSFKTALFGNAVVPAQSTTAALTQYAGASSTWSTANEASGTGYTAGGVAVTPVTWTQTTNVVTFTSSGSPQWTSASFTAYGALIYDTTVSNQAISWNYFGGAQTVTSGTFSITWNTSGILTLTC